jgi:hypothetical protein
MCSHDVVFARRSARTATVRGVRSSGHDPAIFDRTLRMFYRVDPKPLHGVGNSTIAKIPYQVRAACTARATIQRSSTAR